jgi:hypothetical protein
MNFELLEAAAYCPASNAMSGSTELPAVVRPDFVVAAAAIHWSAFPRLEGYLRLYTAIGAHSREHLAICWPGATKTTCVASLRPLCLTTGWAALGLVGVPFHSKQLLLFRTEGEAAAAIGTLEIFVHWAHWMTSFLSYLARVSVIQSLQGLLRENS